MKTNFLLFLVLTMVSNGFSKTIHFTDPASLNTIHDAKPVKILWLDESGKIVLNEEYLKEATDPQRAVLGLIATFVGNDCTWDGPKRADESNLKCKLLTALHLGYQGSNSHLSFLRKWFEGDEKSLEQLQFVTKIPSTDKIRDSFTQIIMLTDGDVIKIYYEAKGVDEGKEKSWNWAEESTWQFTADHVKLTQRRNIKGSF